MIQILKYVLYVLLAFSLFNCQSVTEFTGTRIIDGEGQVVSKEIEIYDLKEIDISNSWNVKLIESSTSKVIIRSHQNIIDLSEITIDDHEFKIKFKQKIGKVDEKSIEVYYTKKLKSIELSALANLIAENEVVLNQLEIDLSSASKAKLNVSTKSLSIETSSSADANITAVSDKTELETSSGSKIDLKLEGKSVSADASSGSILKIKGKAKLFKSKSSSGSNIEATNFNAEKITAEASSGSLQKLFPLESLSANASSGATIKYYNTPENLKTSKSSGGSIKQH